MGRLGMLSGRGGRGKSRLALQLAARMAAMPAARGPFVPAAHGPGNDTAVSDANLRLDATHTGPVVYASWEDERDEAGRRIANFGADKLATPADLAGRLRYLDLRGAGPLWGPGGEARHLAALGELTPVGRRVRATCEILNARLLVVDSLAGAYGGDENVRALVRLFCASWDRWATDTRCAVMLIAHPPKTPGGAGAGQVDRDYAGSTDWHGAARWRWTLDTADTGETTPGRNGSKSRPVEALALQLVKSSYGPDGYRLFLKPSDSWNGWLGVSSTHAAQAALPDGIALEGQTHATQGFRDGDPPSNAPPLNAAALTRLDDPTCREAIARLALSGPGVATLREAQAELQPDYPDTANKLNELINALEAVTKALSAGAAWAQGGGFVFVDGRDVTPMFGTVRIGDKATVYWRECGEALSLFVARGRWPVGAGGACGAVGPAGNGTPLDRRDGSR